MELNLKRIYIAVPCCDRWEITRECLPTVAAGMKPCDNLVMYDDSVISSGFADWQTLGATEYRRVALNSIGIEDQRRRHFRHFIESGFDYLYLTDADCLHDPTWRYEALMLRALTNGAPVCLYNTQAHVRLGGNTIEDNPGLAYIWRRYAPGVSYFLSRAHAETCLKNSDSWRCWDWDCPNALGNRFAISRRSYVDHIGLGGLHHPKGEGLDGGDRALNPTDWLVAKRAEVVKKLGGQ